MSTSIVIIYASLLALLLIALSLNVVRLRQRHQVGIGTGSIQALERAVRAHGNFCEYVPLTVVLLVLVELGGSVPAWSLHLLGLVLVVARLAHAVGLSRSAGASKARIVGTLLTWIVLVVAAGLGLVRGVSAIIG